MKKYRLAIFASGSGSNAQIICYYFKDHPTIEVLLVLSNNSSAGVLEKVKKFPLESRVFSKDDLKENGKVLEWLREKQITHIVLAGFLWLVPNYLIEVFPNSIINIHPALLPKYGGKGMYGMKVHEAIKTAGEKQTGITIHLVNENFDEGQHLFQMQCDVNVDDSPEMIAQKVRILEHRHYPKIIEQWIMASQPQS